MRDELDLSIDIHLKQVEIVWRFQVGQSNSGASKRDFSRLAQPNGHLTSHFPLTLERPGFSLP